MIFREATDDRLTTHFMESLKLSDSQASMVTRIQRALDRKLEPQYAWIRDVFPATSEVVYCLNQVCYRASYSDDGKSATIGDSVRVEMAYMDSTEAQTEVVESLQEFQTLSEAATDGKVKIRFRLISPGQGDKAFYPKEVLKRDGPKVFPKGTHMYWNHPSESEMKDRGVPDLSKLAAVTTGDAEWLDGPEPGLYATAEVFSKYANAIKEIKDHIGTSVRVGGYAKDGQVGGKSTPIMTQFVKGFSVDFVTKAGAGGKVLEVFESVGGELPQIEVKENDMEDSKILSMFGELKDLFTESQKQTAALRDSVVRGNAREAIRLQVSESAKALPQAARTRIEAAVNANLNRFIKDGAVDEPTILAAVQEATRDEVAYIKSFSGSVAVTGLGEGKPPEAADDSKVITESISEFNAITKKWAGIQEEGK